jgi:hypothetical protein
VPGAQAYGQLARELRPSRLAEERVVDAFVSFFGAPAAGAAVAAGS